MKPRHLIYSFLTLAISFLLPGLTMGNETAPAGSTHSNLSAPVTVSGIVTDQDGNTLIGVNVLEAGTNNGTSTDLNGL